MLVYHLKLVKLAMTGNVILSLSDSTYALVQTHTTSHTSLLLVQGQQSENEKQRCKFAHVTLPSEQGDRWLILTM